MKMELGKLQEKTGYVFRDEQLLRNALTHSSFANEHRKFMVPDNERLEFLGDAVLELTTSEFLYHEYPSMPEGEMTKLRASLVCEGALAGAARQIGLPEYLLLGRGEDQTGGRRRDSVISDALEALIGAIYLDGGQEEVRAFILRFVLNDIENKKLFHDSKTILQELVQQKMKHNDVRYEMIREDGPEHARHFEMAVFVGDRELGRGKGSTKKAAQQEAAYHAILSLKETQI